MKRLITGLVLMVLGGMLYAQVGPTNKNVYGIAVKNKINAIATQSNSNLSGLENDSSRIAADSLRLVEIDVSVTDTALYTDFTVAKSDSGLYTADGYATMWGLKAVKDSLEQLINYGGYVSTEYAAVLDAMTTIPTGDTLTWQNALVDSLVINGHWDDIHVMYTPAGVSNGSGDDRINWPNPGTYDASAYTGITWTKLQGWTGDGANAISTNYNPSTASLSQDAASILSYLKIDQQEDNSYIYDASNTDRIMFTPRDVSNVATYRMNSSNSENDSSTDSDGCWINIRRAADDIELYRNGVSVDEATDASTGVPNDELLLLGTGSLYSTNQLAVFIVFNKGLSDTEASDISGWVNTYMTNIGQNEY